MNSYDVIIPCHNGAETVRQAVSSALSCAGVSRVIVVDDGSTDDSLALLRSIQDPRVQVEYQANSGPGAARNRGAAIATANRLIFLDADDELLPDATSVFEAFPLAEVVRSGAIRVTPDGSEQVQLAKSDPRPFPRGAPLAGSFALSRKKFQSIGGYDERMRFGENTELLVRAGEAVGGMGQVPCSAQPTVRITYVPGRNSNHYRRSRIESVDLVVEKHPQLLRRDPVTRRNYYAIASVLLRADGDLWGSFSAASSAALVWPPEGRSCARVLRSMSELVAHQLRSKPLPDGSGESVRNASGSERQYDGTHEP